MNNSFYNGIGKDFLYDEISNQSQESLEADIYEIATTGRDRFLEEFEDLEEMLKL